MQCPVICCEYIMPYQTLSILSPREINVRISLIYLFVLFSLFIFVVADGNFTLYLHDTERTIALNGVRTRRLVSCRCMTNQS